MSSNAGRSTTGGPKVPNYALAPDKEAAKYLRLTAGRYAEERATLEDVEEAISIFRVATQLAAEAKPARDRSLDPSQLTPTGREAAGFPASDPKGPITEASFRRLQELARDGGILEMQISFSKTAGMVIDVVSSVGLPRKIATRLDTEDAATTMIFALEANLEGRRRSKR